MTGRATAQRVAESVETQKICAYQCCERLNVHACARASMSLASTRERRSVRPPKRADDDADAWPARCVCHLTCFSKRDKRFCCALTVLVTSYLKQRDLYRSKSLLDLSYPKV